MSTPLISRKKRNVWCAVSIALAVVAIVLAVLFFNSRAALGNTEQSLADANRTLTATQSELDSTKDTLSATQSELDSTKGTLTATQSELDSTKDVLSATQSELDSTKGTLSATQSELDSTKDTLSATQSELDSTKDTLSATQSELDSTKDTLTATQSELDSTKGTLSATQSELDSTKDTLSATQSELDSTKDTLSATQSELDSTKDTLSATQSELTAVKEELRAAQENAAGAVPAAMDTTPVKIGSYEIDIKSGWKSYEPSKEGYEYYHYGSGATFLMLGAYPVEDMPSSSILQRAMLKQVLASVSSGILSSGNSLSDDDYISLDNDRGTGIYCVAPMLGHDVVIWTYYSADAPTEILCAIYADFNDIGDGVDLLTVIARSAHTAASAAPTASAAPAQSSDSYTIDYKTAADFEAALNSGKNVVGKVVRFSIHAVHPDSALGFNCWAGEHLNFISDAPFDVKAGDILTVRITKFNTILGSWELHYELLNQE